MKLLFKFSIIPVILLIVGASACSRKKTDYLGPAIVAVPDGFTVNNLSSDLNAVDFTTVPVLLSSSFTSSVSWVLTLTGQKSGAVHKLEGTSNGFTDLVWTGAHDGVFFFRQGEKVDVTLSFYGTSYVYTKLIPITITKAANFQTCGKFAQGSNFPSAIGVIPNTGWNGFNTGPPAIVNVEQGVGGATPATVQKDRNGKTVVAPEGTGYYYIKGLGDQATFVSGIGFGTYMPNAKGMYHSLPADPKRVWVNIYLYGTGDPNCGVELEYQEDDDSTDTPDQPNQPGSGLANPVYNGEKDDAFVSKFSLNHVGWKLFSFRYSDLVPSSNAGFGGSGNKIHEPNKLWGFDIVVVKKTDPNKAVEVYMDYPIITVDGPFKPCH